MTKMAKISLIDTLFRLFITKTAENHTLWGRTCLVGILPPPEV